MLGGYKYDHKNRTDKKLHKDMICWQISDFEIDEEKIADTVAIQALGEIQEILKRDELDDFEMVEEIVLIFSKYGIDFGSCHDFG